jgi:hypothetical protein
VSVAQEPFLASGGTAPVGQAQFGMLETQLRELRFHEDAGCEDLKGVDTYFQNLPFSF